VDRGPNGAAGRATTEVVTNLAAGSYLVACLIPGPDGVPHAALGMLSELTVTGAAPVGASVGQHLPVAELQDYHFVLPDGFGTGPVEVINRGTQVHELAVAQLHAGTTVRSALAWEAQPAPKRTPAPYTLVAGVTAIDPGERARLDLALPAGDYVALCFLPSPGGAAHFARGMVYPFTVRRSG
jgi:hypothetical protein